MIKQYSFFAYWRKKDVEFLNSLGLKEDIEEGADVFLIEESETYNKIIAHYSKKNSLFSKTKLEKFSCVFTGVIFSKEELDQGRVYDLIDTGVSKGFPLPEDTFEDDIFTYDCRKCESGKKQKAPFRITKPKWKKNEVNFTLRDRDFIFFKKDFFQEVLAPLGLKSREVIIHNTGKITEDVVQLIIPEAKSKLLIEGTTYDREKPCEKCNIKQYSIQTLDFFPAFENKFEFLICKTKEEFLGGRRRIIITKTFCDLLVKHKVIKFNTNHLTPMVKVK
ncbi:MAG: hypothetical protein V3U92_07495 [Cellulophaga sp.]